MKRVEIGPCTLYCGDCLDVLPTLEAVDACVTDPPYGLEFMGKDWDSFNGWQAGSGFSAPGIGERPTEWPSFTACNDEFGGANPTCANCGGRARGKRKCNCEAPDWRVKGAKPDPMYGRKRQMAAFQQWCASWSAALLPALTPASYMLTFGGTRTYHRLTCAVEDAGFEIRDCLQWIYGSGFPKGRGCLKPAYEPILLCRKPGPKVRELGIDECRVGFDGPADEQEAKNKNRHADFGSGPRGNRVFGDDKRQRGENGNYNSPGRWPANVVHDGSDEVLEAFAAFGESSGKLRVNDRTDHREHREQYRIGPGKEGAIRTFGDTGTAARFFYCAKASRKERGDGNTHPTVKPLALMQWLVKLVCPPDAVCLDHFMGSCTTGLACIRTGRRFIGIEKDPGYFAIACKRIRAELKARACA